MRAWPWVMGALGSYGMTGAHAFDPGHPPATLAHRGHPLPRRLPHSCAQPPSFAEAEPLSEFDSSEVVGRWRRAWAPPSRGDREEVRRPVPWPGDVAPITSAHVGAPARHPAPRYQAAPPTGGASSPFGSPVPIDSPLPYIHSHPAHEVLRQLRAAAQTRNAGTLAHLRHDPSAKYGVRLLYQDIERSGHVALRELYEFLHKELLGGQGVLPAQLTRSLGGLTPSESWTSCIQVPPNAKGIVAFKLRYKGPTLVRKLVDRLTGSRGALTPVVDVLGLSILTENERDARRLAADIAVCCRQKETRAITKFGSTMGLRARSSGWSALKFLLHVRQPDPADLNRVSAVGTLPVEVQLRAWATEGEDFKGELAELSGEDPCVRYPSSYACYAKRRALTYAENVKDPFFREMLLTAASLFGVDPRALIPH